MEKANMHAAEEMEEMDWEKLSLDNPEAKQASNALATKRELPAPPPEDEEASDVPEKLHPTNRDGETERQKPAPNEEGEKRVESSKPQATSEAEAGSEDNAPVPPPRHASLRQEEQPEMDEPSSAALGALAARSQAALEAQAAEATNSESSSRLRSKGGRIEGASKYNVLHRSNSKSHSIVLRPIETKPRRGDSLASRAISAVLHEVFGEIWEKFVNDKVRSIVRRLERDHENELVERQGAVEQQQAAYYRNEINRARTDEHEAWDHVRHLEELVKLREHSLRTFQERYRNHQGSLHTQTQQAVQDKNEAVAELKRMKENHKVVLNDLKDLKSEVFRLQPRDDSTDSDFSGQYDTLFRNIGKWVDALFMDSDIDLPTVLPRIAELADENLREILEDLGPVILKENSMADSLIVQHIIFRHIDKAVFNSSWACFGIDEATTTLLKDIEDSMRTLKPPRDPTTINTWRSETLRSLLDTPKVRTARTAREKSITDDSLVLLSPLFPENDNPTSIIDDFHKRITQPAVSLAMNIALSTSKYYIEPRDGLVMYKDYREGDILYHTAFRFAELINAKTLKVVKPESVYPNPEDGRIGRELLVIRSAMWKLGTDDKGQQRQKLVAKALVISKMDTPPARRAPEGKSLMGKLLGM